MSIIYTAVLGYQDIDDEGDYYFHGLESFESESIDDLDQMLGDAHEDWYCRLPSWEAKHLQARYDDRTS